MKTSALVAGTVSLIAAVAGIGTLPNGGWSDPVYQSHFERGAAEWAATDPQCWRVIQTEDHGAVYSLFKKDSSYQPKFRSPLSYSLLKDKKFADFQLDVQVKSTHEPYDHRDVCLFFGYQGPTKFYYVHLGQKTDPHANQIFIVNNAERTKISATTSDGTAWDDQWHHVRVQRETRSGGIRVYFDDMDNPVMTASDKTFAWGQIGLGSFDDTVDFADVQISGTLVPDWTP